MTQAEFDSRMDDHIAQVKSFRLSQNLSQSALANALGMRQPDVSKIETGRVSLAQMEKFVHLLSTIPKSELSAKVRGETIEKKKEKKVEPPKSAIARELGAFLRKHAMTRLEFAEFSRLNYKMIGGVLRGDIVPNALISGDIRSAMRKYTGENTPTTEQFKPRIAEAFTAPAPQTPGKILVKEVPVVLTDKLDPKEMSNTSETMRPVVKPDGVTVRRAEYDPPAELKPKEKKPASPPIQLVVEDGARINNGENIAPLLRLDGQTMHVFTLVPGGVFVSYVTVNME